MEEDDTASSVGGGGFSPCDSSISVRHRRTGPVTRRRSGEPTASQETGCFFRPVVIPHQFMVLPAWQDIISSGTQRPAAFATQITTYLQEIEEPEAMGPVGAFLASYMIKPNSLKFLAWHALGMLLIAWDLVWIPMMAFNPADVPFTLTMAWLARVFWSADIPCSFLTGYFMQNGINEMHPRRVARHYATTWLPFDLVLVTIEWVDVATASTMDYTSTARLGKSLRTLRVLRMVRMARLLKLPGFLGAFTDHIFSETALLVAHITKVTLGIVSIAHCIACLFYALSTAAGGRSWIRRHGFEEEGLEHRYVASVYWAMTQFIGNGDIYPSSLAERLFAVFVLILVFLLSTFFVSSITTSMTRLQMISSVQQTQFSTLRRYLHNHSIPRQLVTRVTRNAQYALRAREANVLEEDVELLQLLSEPMRIELHFEVHSHVLRPHSYFHACCQRNAAAMRKICHSVMRPFSVLEGDILFNAGEHDNRPHMLFVISGQLEYNKHGVVDELHPSMWVSETNLWTHWEHRGTLRAVTKCTLLEIDAQKFASEALRKFPCDYTHPAWYAKWYVGRLNNYEGGDLTDMDAGISAGYEMSDDEHLQKPAHNTMFTPMLPFMH